MHVAQNWRLNGARYAMNAVKCDQCGNVLFPVRAVCPHCAESTAATHKERYTFEAVTDRPFATIGTENVSDSPFELRQAAR